MEETLKKFTINKQTLFNEDCIKTMQSLDEKCIDVICTSPVYNLNMPYGTYQDKLPKNQYLEWMQQVFDQMQRVLKEDGSLFLNMGASTDPWLDLEVFYLLKDKLFKIFIGHEFLRLTSFVKYFLFNSDSSINNSLGIFITLSNSYIFPYQY